jgi:hypothetical protein
MRALRLLLVVPLAMTSFCGGKEFTAAESGDVGGSLDSTGSAGSAIGGAGGDVGNGGSGNGGSRAGNGGSGGGVDAGRPKNSGDCDTATDCGGDPCVEISPGGYRVCVTKVPEATTCDPAGGCCKTADCAAAGKPGRCILGPALPNCGGPVQAPINVCATDDCKATADCHQGSNPICVPAGVFGHKKASCFPGGCRRDIDCNDGPGGACLPISGPCCPGPIGLYCVYNGGCVNDADCPNGHCDISTGKAVCAPGGVACAASL